MQSYAIGNPDYSVAWHGQAVDGLRALDAFAEQEGFARYSDLVRDEEVDQDCGGLICQLEDGTVWAIFTNYSVTPEQTDFLLSMNEDEKLYVPRTNEQGDLICPICGRGIEAQWADDGESDLADWFHCDERLGGCGVGGALVKVDDPTVTQNGVTV